LAWGASATAAPLRNITDLRAILDANLRPGSPVTIEQLLPLLPREFRNGSTLIRESQSNQEGTPEAPRAILYGPDAKFVLTFNGKGNTLEIMQWNDATARFTLMEVTMPYRGRGDVNERPDCGNCHGNPSDPDYPKVNFDPHNTWIGAYCSMSHGGGVDAACSARVEAKEMAAFNAKRASHPRYRHIPTLPADEVQRRLAASGIARGVAPNLQLCPSGDSLEPNTRLNDLLSELNFKRILSLLKASPAWNNYKYAFTSLALGCTDACTAGNPGVLGCPSATDRTALAPVSPDRLVPAEARTRPRPLATLRAETNDAFDLDASVRFADFREPNVVNSTCGNPVATPQNLDTQDLSLVTATRYLAGRMGVSMENWPTAKDRGGMGGRFSFRNSQQGLDRVYELLLLELMRTPDSDLPDVRPLVEAFSPLADRADYRRVRFRAGTTAARATACSALTARSRDRIALAREACDPAYPEPCCAARPAGRGATLIHEAGSAVRLVR
jgi:hypothetical protein